MAKYDVVIKKVEPLNVVSVRGVVPSPPDQNLLWNELGAYLARQRTRPKGASLVLYHQEGPEERGWDIEVCLPVAKDLDPTQRINVYSLPGVETMASVIHAGPLAKISAAHAAIHKWLEEYSYQIAGPYREVCIRAAYPDGNQNDPNTITEIQYPVAKIE